MQQDVPVWLISGQWNVSGSVLCSFWEMPWKKGGVFFPATPSFLLAGMWPGGWCSGSHLGPSEERLCQRWQNKNGRGRSGPCWLYCHRASLVPPPFELSSCKREMYCLCKPLLLRFFFHWQQENLILTNMVGEILRRKLDLYQESLWWKIVSKAKFEPRTFNFAGSVFHVFRGWGFYFIFLLLEGILHSAFFPELRNLKTDILVVLLRYNWYTKKCTYLMYANRSFWSYANPFWNHYYTSITSKSFLVPLRFFVLWLEH